MKITFSLVACLIAMTSWATVITVSNTPNFPAMYNAAQTAVDAAADGDTVQVFPSVTSYGDLNITHGITLIGSGLGSSFRSFFFRIDCATVSAVHLLGLEISYLGQSSTIGGNNWIIESCKINYNFNLAGIWNNVLVKHCFGMNYLDNMYDDNGLVFSNNVFVASPFTGEILVGNQNLNNSSTTATFFGNNYFQGSVRFRSANLLFNDNVFQNVLDGLPNDACYTCIFQNNYSFCQSCLISNISSAVSINNIENGPNPFVNESSDLSQADFNLVASSTAINAGVNGTDIGIHAGLFPPSEGLHYGLFVPGMPVIDLFTIVNPIIEQNGQLEIQAVSTIPAAD